MKFTYNTFNTNEFESHMLAIDMIESGAVVLDIGCATGYFAKELQKKNCVTWGVDYNPEAVKRAKKYCRKAVVLNLDKVTSLPFPKNKFDFVLIMDVIEHLQRPENILAVIKPYLKKNGKVIVSVPNIAHASIRWMLINGNFKYTSTGILDKTHLHFYTKNSLEDTLKKAGYKILKTIPTNGVGKVPFLYKITDRLLASWQYRLVLRFPTLFSFQFIALAKLC